MKNVGWEIRPLGWSLIILVTGLMLYVVLEKKPQNEPRQNEDKNGETL